VFVVVPPEVVLVDAGQVGVAPVSVVGLHDVVL
jgi:hypothetical protein